MNPPDAPPSYDAATSASAQTTGASSSTNPSSSSSNPHKTRNGIPPQSRRSMEDEARALPTGWVRQFDPESHHQFFVDTTKEPPRSTWQHPYDDDTYLNSLSPEEQARIHGLHRVPSEADIIAESSDDDDHHTTSGKPGTTAGPREHYPNTLPRRGSPEPKGIHKFGRRMKDKLTSSTHVERQQQRQHRAEEEERIYRQHQAYREAMARAMETGEPQLLGKDKQGRDVFIEPPYGYGGYGAAGGPIGGGFGGRTYPGQGNYGHGGVGYNPYQQGGPYAAPNARYIRPQVPYARPYGYGYGGGLGLPIGLGLGAGLLTTGLLF
jgi:hypothetical protein